jgi:hypothetical protein
MAVEVAVIITDTPPLITLAAAQRLDYLPVGVSGNIIDASFQALVDAITYRLLKVGVAAQ